MSCGPDKARAQAGIAAGRPAGRISREWGRCPGGGDAAGSPVHSDSQRAGSAEPGRRAAARRGRKGAGLDQGEGIQEAGTASGARWLRGAF